MTVLDDHAADILRNIDEFASAVAEHERQAALLELTAARLEATGAFGLDGTVSMSAWLRNHLRMTPQRASQLLSNGRFLDKSDAFAQAAVSGELSASQIDVAARTGKTKYTGILAETQEGLVETLKELDIHQTVRVVNHWIHRADALLDDKAPSIERPNELTYSPTMDDVTHGTFRLSEAAGTEFDKAIQTAITHLGKDETRTTAERQGDALFDIAAFFNKNHAGNERPRNLPNVTLSADASAVGTERPEGVNVDTQRPMSPACTDTYLCDCRIHVILRDARGTTQLRTHRPNCAVATVQASRRPRRLLPLPRLRSACEMDRCAPHPLLATRRKNRLRQPDPVVLQTSPPCAPTEHHHRADAQRRRVLHHFRWQAVHLRATRRTTHIQMELARTRARSEPTRATTAAQPR